MIISDLEWELFVNDNIVDDDIIEVIAIRIKIGRELTDRELAIYQVHGKRVERMLKHI